MRASRSIPNLPPCLPRDLQTIWRSDSEMQRFESGHHLKRITYKGRSKIARYRRLVSVRCRWPELQIRITSSYAKGLRRRACAYLRPSCHANPIRWLADGIGSSSPICPATQSGLDWATATAMARDTARGPSGSGGSGSAERMRIVPRPRQVGHWEGMGCWVCVDADAPHVVVLGALSTFRQCPSFFGVALNQRRGAALIPHGRSRLIGSVRVQDKFPFEPHGALAIASLRELAKAENGCTRCPLYKHATQGVPGEGRKGAHLMLVGEQPGDKEDLAGKPFVGPAGRVLDRALEAAGNPPHRSLHHQCGETLQARDARQAPPA